MANHRLPLQRNRHLQRKEQVMKLEIKRKEMRWKDIMIG